MDRWDKFLLIFYLNFMYIFIIVIRLKSVCEINFFLFQDPKEAGSDDEEAYLDEDEINKRFVSYSKD